MSFRSLRWVSALACCAMSGAGCGGTGDGAGPDGGTEPPGQLHGACMQSERIGGFVVSALESYSIADGKVGDRVSPATVPTEVARQGDCALLRRETLVCDPPCASGTECAPGGACVPQPLLQDVGTVTIEGLAGSVEMEPLPPGNNYFDTMLPHPAYEVGAAIRLRSTAGKYGVLELYGVGSVPLEVGGEVWLIEEGKSLAVAWNQPGQATPPTEVVLRLTIDQHGNSPLSLACTFADTGAGEVPDQLLGQLVAAGASGYPNGQLTRRTVDSTEVSDGCVDFSISSPRPHDVRVAGHIPCTKPADCPDGYSCDTSTETCTPQ